VVTNAVASVPMSFLGWASLRVSVLQDELSAGLGRIGDPKEQKFGGRDVTLLLNVQFSAFVLRMCHVT
jgi:hypothetical protein